MTAFAAPELLFPLLQFQSATASLDAADLLPLLQKLDDCIGYVSANPQYADASSYATRFRQLQVCRAGEG